MNILHAHIRVVETDLDDPARNPECPKNEKMGWWFLLLETPLPHVSHQEAHDLQDKNQMTPEHVIGFSQLRNSDDSIVQNIPDLFLQDAGSCPFISMTEAQTIFSCARSGFA